MDEERPSRTAEGVAIQRALHQTLDAEPKILDDPIAIRLVDPSTDLYKTFLGGLGGNAARFEIAAPGIRRDAQPLRRRLPG